MKHSLLIAAGLCFAMLGCKQSESNSAVTMDSLQAVQEADRLSANAKTENLGYTDSVAVGNGSSSAAVENPKDTEHKFLRTSDVKFKVKNVEAATYKIEDITNRHGGFVTFTHLNSTIDNVATTPISADSSLETTSFTVANTMTIRVPNIRLDTTLKYIAKLVDYLDYRIIKADDVSLQLQGNTMAQTRMAANRQRLAQAIDNRGKKLTDVTEAEESLLDKQQQADDALLENMSLNDQVKYSTVQLQLYQRQGIKRELIANDKNIAAYKPGFGSRLLDSLQSGLEVVADILVSLTKLWWLFLFVIIGWIAYKKYGLKFGK